MNCQKGDLAIIVGSHPTFSQYVGRIFRCKELDTDCDGRPVWLTPWTYLGGTLWAEDYLCRPLRGEPEKETDERVAELELR